MADMESFRAAVTAWTFGGGPAEPARRLADDLGVRTAVLLEGLSDSAALDTLAAAHGRDLAAEGVCVLPMGGAMNVGRYAANLGRDGLGLRLTGLCDEGERGYYERGWQLAGAAAPDIHVCVADLEDELIRTLGVGVVRELVEDQGDGRALEVFLRQPAQRVRTAHQQLHRFLSTKSGRKIHYGHVLAAALTPGHPATPLTALLAGLLAGL
ncbi:TOPRIM nucleotidyl transferase/hydrolase domain-containing protein [Kitasatospora sp. NPDC101183]|uniref:TOPRIM nucleotidyl transferase/hydrolase domain-containing protein n=1 Tax=Kitasatospora sp. NPDC101183 TaxID=3364100 RepID=UPI00380B4178